MLAGAHLVGAGDLKAYLKSDGKIKPEPEDGNHTKISEYIREFANYDMESITGIKPNERVVYEDCKYTVKEGDNLSKIAKQFHTTVNRIVKASKINENDLLHAGDELTVPARKITD